MSGGVARIVALAILLFQAAPGPPLPAPFATPWYRKNVRIVAMPDGHHLTVPAGFTVTLFADGLQIRALHDAGAERRRHSCGAAARATAGSRSCATPITTASPTRGLTFASGLNRPFGLAFWKDFLYVGNNDSVVRFAYTTGQTAATGRAREGCAICRRATRRSIRTPPIGCTSDLNQTRGYNHWTRNVIFNRAGTKFYVTVGSATNATPENDPGAFERAAIHEYNPDGSGHRLVASGLRNPVGLADYPGTDALWTAVNERDQLGDDLVPDFLTSVTDGGFYGWPYSYIGQHLDPTVTSQKPDLVARAIVPDVLLPPHAAALGLLFYTGTQFPGEYRNSAFVAMHGSINRSKMTGYSVMRVPFKNGKPSGPAEDFLTGFITRDDDSKEAWGRPVGLLQLADGSLLVSDDGGNRIWRVSYSR